MGLPVPWLKSTCFRVDWLHAADQGVAADFLGNLLYYLVKEHMPGGNEKDKCGALWKEIQVSYDNLGIQDRLQNLVITMLKKSNAGSCPKLRASAAQARALVPIAKELANKYLSSEIAMEGAMMAAADALSDCYMALSSSSIFWRETLSEKSRRFAAQFVALEEHQGDGTRWRVKPKMHLFLEMCAEGSKPSLVWTYRDEDFGGSCARMARRRGGLQRPPATSKNLLCKFRMQNSVPALR